MDEIRQLSIVLQALLRRYHGQIFESPNTTWQGKYMEQELGLGFICLFFGQKATKPIHLLAFGCGFSSLACTFSSLLAASVGCIPWILRTTVKVNWRLVVVYVQAKLKLHRTQDLIGNDRYIYICIIYIWYNIYIDINLYVYIYLKVWFSMYLQNIYYACIFIYLYALQTQTWKVPADYWQICLGYFLLCVSGVSWYVVHSSIAMFKVAVA